MQMTIRWFGKDKDTVTLEQIRQIPGVCGVVPALHKLPAGEVWPLDVINGMKKEIEDVRELINTYIEYPEIFKDELVESSQKIDTLINEYIKTYINARY